MVGHAQTSGNSSVANLSLGGSLSPALNSATAAAVLAGISMIVAAGNDNRDACNYSPASTDTAVTVGATDDKDNRADYSNYGPCLDIFGPGSSIKSAYIGSPSATATLSGTSMATPHIAGIAAVYQSIYNSSLTPTQVTEIILSQATANVLKDVNGTRPIGEDESPNLMGYVYTCNGTNSEDDHGIFGTTKSAFRALSVIFLCFSGFELGISIPSLYTSDDIFVLTYRTGIITLLMQCVLLPAVTLCIIEFGQFHKEYALSMIFVSIAPSGVISSVVSNYSKLNTHLAGVLSFFSNIISLLTVPLLCYIWIVRLWKLDEDTANISWNRFLAALVMMTLLTATGITIRAYCGKFFSKFLDVLISAGNALLFTIIMILGVSIYRDDISHASHTLWAVALLLQLFGGVSGWILSYILRVPFLDRLTVSIDTAGRGFILAISLLSFAFHSEKKEDLIVYPLIFGIVALVNLFWVIPFYRFISWFFIRSQRQETPGSDGVIFVESTLIGPSNPVSSAPPERNYSLQRTGGTPSPLVMNYANDDLNKALVVGGDGREYVY